MTDYLDATGALDIARGMNRQHLECRVGRHHFRPENSVVNKQYRYRHNVYRCACGSVKNEITTQDFPFRVLDTYIDYAEGYLLHGVGRIAGDARDVLRGVRLERSFARPRVMRAKEARETPPPRSRAKRALGIESEPTPEADSNVVNLHSRRKAG